MIEKSFILSWITIGLVSTIICTIHDMRGKEYDPKEFDTEYCWVMCVLICLGYFSLIPIIFFYIKEYCNIKPLSYYIHKLVNIGVKKEKK